MIKMTDNDYAVATEIKNDLRVLKGFALPEYVSSGLKQSFDEWLKKERLRLDEKFKELQEMLMTFDELKKEGKKTI